MLVLQTRDALLTLRRRNRTFGLQQSTQTCADELHHLADADCLQ